MSPYITISPIESPIIDGSQYALHRYFKLLHESTVTSLAKPPATACVSLKKSNSSGNERSTITGTTCVTSFLDDGTPLNSQSLVTTKLNVSPMAVIPAIARVPSPKPAIFVSRNINTAITVPAIRLCITPLPTISFISVTPSPHII